MLAPSPARGVAFGDFDNDGSVDILVNNMNELPSLLHNVSSNTNHWLKVKTIGTRSNRNGIGSRVSIFYGQHGQTDEVRSGGSWASHSDLRVHFGLGSVDKLDRVEVRWPSGLTENLYDVRADQLLVVREGAQASR